MEQIVGQVIWVRWTFRQKREVTLVHNLKVLTVKDSKVGQGVILGYLLKILMILIVYLCSHEELYVKNLLWSNRVLEGQKEPCVTQRHRPVWPRELVLSTKLQQGRFITPTPAGPILDSTKLYDENLID